MRILRGSTVVALIVLAQPASADLFKCKDAAGKITYSELKQAGMTCTPVTTEITVVPGTPARASESPKVDPNKQRREELSNKIKAQEKELEAAKQELAKQEAGRKLGETFYQNYLDRVKPYREKVQELEKALAQTKSELDKLK